MLEWEDRGQGMILPDHNIGNCLLVRLVVRSFGKISGRRTSYIHCGKSYTQTPAAEGLQAN